MSGENRNGIGGSPRTQRNTPKPKPGPRIGFVGMMLSLLAISRLLGVAGASAEEWLPARHRFKGVYEAGAIGNMGLQYQSVVAWNQGTGDPARRGWIVTGEDVNRVWLSKDYGATWTIPRLTGMFCSRMAGLYLDTDDDVFVAVGDAFGNERHIQGLAGLYVGGSDLLSARRVALRRKGGEAFARVLNGGVSGRNINCIGRRPQTGGLTFAERPIIVIEQAMDRAYARISAIYVWTSPDNGGNWRMVRELPVADYASGSAGIFQVQVAPNGDVLLLGEKGAFLSRDVFASAPAKIYPASGGQQVTSGVFFGGSATTASGARIGIGQANPGGVFETANIRTDGFTKPNGNAGLPAGYAVWFLGASPLNPDRLAVCTTGRANNPAHAPFLSTDGGKTFTKITTRAGAGDSVARYEVRVLGSRGQAGFYFCPTDELKCLAPTAQTMSRSIDGAATTDGNLVSGFDGMSVKGGCGFDALDGDWRKILRICQDTWVNTATDGMHWVAPGGLGTGNAGFKAALAEAGAGNKGYLSGATGVMGPNNRVIAAANRDGAAQKNVMVVAELDAAGRIASYRIATPNRLTRATRSRRSPKDDDVAFVGRWTVSNLGARNPADVVFTDHDSHEIIDCLLDADGRTLVSYWANVTSGGNDSGKKIYRSTEDKGANNHSTPWFTVDASFTARAICADHFDPERVLYAADNAPDVIREIRRVDGRLRDSALVNLRTMAGGIAAVLAAESPGIAVPKGATAIRQLLADPNQAGVFYAIAGLHGMPNWWRTVDNGRTWINLSGNAPRTMWTGEIHPLTGEVMGFSNVGEYIHQSPAVYPDMNGNRDALTGQMRAYFAEKR